MEYNLDARGEILGRLASQIAILLMGKNKTDFTKHELADVKVNVINASKLNITRKKMKQTEYQKYSGFPGGRKVENMEKIISTKGFTEILKKAVYGMLPANKLRPLMMKNLIITE